MNDFDSDDDAPRGGRLRISRSRGAMSGLLLILLGVWGAAVPFVGPSFDFAYTPGGEWTTGRGWLEVLPGAVTAIGGLLLLMSRNRATAMLGGWMSVVAGAWFVVGRALAGPLNLGQVGAPAATSETQAGVARAVVLLRAGGADRVPRSTGAGTAVRSDRA